MRTRKYVLRPGFVRSANDNDAHYVGAGELMRLYGVHPRECSIALTGLTRLDEDQILLRPRADGNYALPTSPETPHPRTAQIPRIG